MPRNVGALIGRDTELDSLAHLLDERFRVLTGGRRGALPRQRTLHATLDWSFGLLTATERVVFRRLGRFIVDQCRSTTIAHRVSWGWILGNLFGILTERGDLDEALATARQAIPYLRESESAWIIMDHFSLRLAKLGQIEAAARLLGWTDATFAAKNNQRQPNESRAVQTTLTLLQARLSADRLAQLRHEGAQIDEEEACHLAILA